MKNKLILLMGLVLLVSGCQPQSQVADNAPKETTTMTTTASVAEAEQTTEAPTESTTVEVTTTVVRKETGDSPIAYLLIPETTAADIGMYIRDNIAQATPDEAEEMLFWLMVYQTQTKISLDSQLYEEAYIRALNETMEGVLDPDKVKLIKDPVVKKDFQSLVDGFMTIVRYEETPVIETDWYALSAYTEAYSDTVATLINKWTERRDFTASEDYYQTAQNALMIEKLMGNDNSEFMNSQLERLYRGFINDVMVGPEGSYLGTFVGKNDARYEALMSFAMDHQASSFGAFIINLDKKTWTDYLGPNEELIRFLSFGSNNIVWEEETINNESREAIIYSLAYQAKPEVAQKINRHMASVIADMALAADDYYSVRTYPYYNGNRYLSAAISLSYGQGAQTTYMERYLSYNMLTGEPVTISDYMGLSDEETIETINELTGTNFKELPQFSFTGDGLFVIPAPSDDLGAAYATISLKDLVPYVSREDLLR